MAKIVPPMNFGLVEDGKHINLTRDPSTKADPVSRLLPLGPAFRAQFLILGEIETEDFDLGGHG